MIELPKRSRPDIHADINIVPYIDVMLVLLVIFMMTTPIIEQGVEVDLPSAPAGALGRSTSTPCSIIGVVIIKITKRTSITSMYGTILISAWISGLERFGSSIIFVSEVLQIFPQQKRCICFQCLRLVKRACYKQSLLVLLQTDQKLSQLRPQQYPAQLPQS